MFAHQMHLATMDVLGGFVVYNNGVSWRHRYLVVAREACDAVNRRIARRLELHMWITHLSLPA